MNLLEMATPLGLPHWSPYAIAVGFACGMLTGAVLTGAYALHLVRQRRVTLGLLRVEAPDPADRVSRVPAMRGSGPFATPRPLSEVLDA